MRCGAALLAMTLRHKASPSALDETMMKPPERIIIRADAALHRELVAELGAEVQQAQAHGLARVHDLLDVDAASALVRESPGPREVVEALRRQELGREEERVGDDVLRARPARKLNALVEADEVEHADLVRKRRRDVRDADEAGQALVAAPALLEERNRSRVVAARAKDSVLRAKAEEKVRRRVARRKLRKDALRLRQER